MSNLVVTRRKVRPAERGNKEDEGSAGEGHTSGGGNHPDTVLAIRDLASFVIKNKKNLEALHLLI